jgi:hypothetical protein
MELRLFFLLPEDHGRGYRFAWTPNLPREPHRRYLRRFCHLLVVFPPLCGRRKLPTYYHDGPGPQSFCKINMLTLVSPTEFTPGHV